MSLNQILEIVVLWGLVALLLLALAIGRARSRVFYPVPRESAPSKTCSNCRLPFYRSSWRCGRCGAYMKPRLFYWLGLFLLEPLLALIVVPWILLVGMILSSLLWFFDRFLPELARPFERITNRLGVWITPLFGRWVPKQWQFPAKETTLLPNELDAPADAVVIAALTLGTSLLEEGDEELEVYVPHPGEETLAILRRSHEGIHEIWGYVSDGHTLVPSFADEIIGAVCGGDETLDYTDGLVHHLEESFEPIMVRHGRETWHFLLRKEPPRRGRYPIRWEVHAPRETLVTLAARVDELESWDTLPCGLVIE